MTLRKREKTSASFSSLSPTLVVVGAARSGQEAIEIATETKPDIVLMDIDMEDMDGITATESILREVPFTQVIILSVQSEQDYMRRAMMAGARDFMVKPPSQRGVDCDHSASLGVRP